MKQAYYLTTDSDSELPLELVRRYNVIFVPMPYTLDGEDIPYDMGETTDFKQFYHAMRTGSIPKTNTFPPQYYYDLWQPMLAEGKDVLHISFSSGLSSAYSFLTSAKQQLEEEYPDRRVVTVDTLSISGGMSALLYGALQRYHDGASLEDVVAYCEQTIPKVWHWFTVNDLDYLRRGGRLSAGTAMVGQMLSVKPILHVDGNGKIVVADKVMGRKKALRLLVDKCVELARDTQDNILIVLHGDCEAEGIYVRDAILAHLQFKEVFLQYVGPVIGAHAGPDVLGVCFLGEPHR